MILLDDVLTAKGVKGSKRVQEMFVQSRHYNVSVVLISQQPNNVITPTIKSNATHVLFSVLSPDQLETLCGDLMIGDMPGKTASAKKAATVEWVNRRRTPYVFNVCDQMSGSMFKVKAPFPNEPAAAPSCAAGTGLPVARALLPSPTATPEPAPPPAVSEPVLTTGGGASSATSAPPPSGYCSVM